MNARLARRAGGVGIALILTLAGMPQGSVPASARAADIVDGFLADSEPGDPIGGGVTTFMNMTGVSVLVVEGGKVVGVQATAFDSGGAWWDFSFYAPLGQAFVVGTTYLDVGVDRTATKGAMEVRHSVRGSCTRDDARFWLRQIGSALAVDFRYRCAGTTATLYGSFRSESTVALRTLTGPADAVAFGNVAVAGTKRDRSITLTVPGPSAVTIAGLALKGPAAADYTVKSETCTAAPIDPRATCTVTVTFDPSLGGGRPAALEVDDNTYRGSRSISLSGTGTLPTSDVAWSGTAAAGPPNTWNVGAALAQTVTGPGTGYLHVVAATDRIGSTWVGDNGPYAGILVSRRPEGGTTWSSATRLNPTNQHGYAPAVAASGSNVYATWVRPSKWVAWDPTAPRTVYFRRNANHGSGTWTAPLALTSTSGRVDYPTLAASGSMVYVAYTDAVSGYVKIAISADRGSTWRRTSIGPTTGQTADGYEGDPSVAAAGDLVVVSWTTGPGNAVKARISIDRGTTWKAATTLVTSSSDLSTTAARGSRLAVGWATTSGAAVRVWSGGAWSPVRPVGPAYGTTATYVRHETATVALGGSGQVGIAWSACSAGCSKYDASTRHDVVWAESGDNGASWHRTQVLGPAAVSAARRVNDFPSVVWPTSTSRHVAFNGWTPNSTSYRLYLRTGSGMP